MVDLINASIPPGFRIFIGVAEVLAAVGLTLPGITHVLPWLIPCAAVGLMIVMMGATVVHVTRVESGSAVTTGILFVAAAFVAYMRWKVEPILRRSDSQPLSPERRLH
jgi:hypothetical protein